MKYYDIPQTDMHASAIALGCMRIGNGDADNARRLIQTAIDEGINYFDHADIYGGGTSEEIFARAFQKCGTPRDKIYIQTKCGIRSGMYDFSKEHILQSVEGSLKRLGTDYLDALLLHRPDALMEPEEVAEAFDVLHESGKVRYFGVSNQNSMQMALLQKFVRQPLIFNQLQFSIAHCMMISSGINVNMGNDSAVMRDGSVLDFCRLHDITIQPWSPFMSGFFRCVFLDNEEFPELNKKLDELAEKYQVTNTAVAAAWILRHPANMQPIVGTAKPERLKSICRAADITLTREEWYAVYRAAGNQLP